MTARIDTAWRLRLGESVTLLGPEGVAATPRSRKARALVAFLALQPDRRASRERLTDLLWSDRGRDQARASLRQCLHELRSEAPGLIETNAEAVALVDVAVEAGWELALEGLDHLDPAFDRWRAEVRADRPLVPMASAYGVAPTSPLPTSWPLPVDAPRAGRARWRALTGAAVVIAAIAAFLVGRPPGPQAPRTATVPVIGVIPLEVTPHDLGTMTLADRLLGSAVDDMPGQRAVFRRVERAAPPPPGADWTIGGELVGGPRGSVHLWIRSAGGLELWSTSAEAGRGGIEGAGRLATGRLAKAMICALGGPPIRRTADTLALLFQPCQQINMAVETDTAHRLLLMRRFVGHAPKDPLAHAMMSASLVFAAEDAEEDGLRREAAAERAEARAESARALELDPRTGEAYLAPIELANTTGHFALAEALAHRGLAVDPDNPQLHSFLGEILAETGRTKEALAEMRRALALDPAGVGKSVGVAGLLASAGQPRAGLAVLDAVETRFPGNAAISDQRFNILLGMRDLGQARALLDDSLRGNGPLEPKQIETRRRWIAAIEHPRSQQADALERKLVETTGTSSGPKSFAVLVLSSIGRIDAARAFALKFPLRSETQVLFAPEARVLLHDPRFPEIARAQGLWGLWTATGRWPDICAEPRLAWRCDVKSPSG